MGSILFIREIMADAIPAEASESATVRPRSSSLMAAELGHSDEAKSSLPFSDALRSSLDEAVHPGLEEKKRRSSTAFYTLSASAGARLVAKDLRDLWQFSRLCLTVS